MDDMEDRDKLILELLEVFNLPEDKELDDHILSEFADVPGG